MKIAVTGASGFIGSHFISLALSDNHYINALRRSSSSLPRIHLRRHPNWINSDLDNIQIDDLLACDVLVHFAAHTANVPYDNLQNCLKWNVKSALDLLEKARIAGIKNYIIAGSCFEYGKSGENYKLIPTSAPLEPTNPYAASKAAASVVLSSWAREYNLNLEILRIFQVYGEGESLTRFWPSLRQAALAGEDFNMTLGEQIRDFQHVEQVARTFLSRATRIIDRSPSVDIFNLSSENPMSLADFASSQWSELNATGDLKLGAIQYRQGEVMQYIPGQSLISIVNPD